MTIWVVFAEPPIPSSTHKVTAKVPGLRYAIETYRSWLVWPSPKSQW